MKKSYIIGSFLTCSGKLEGNSSFQTSIAWQTLIIAEALEIGEMKMIYVYATNKS